MLHFFNLLFSQKDAQYEQAFGKADVGQVITENELQVVCLIFRSLFVKM